FHQSGKIPPNTYIIDVDVLKSNTEKIAGAASKNDIELYYMTKQLGRISHIADIIEDHGIPKAVAVDFDEGKILADKGMDIGHIGHLVQPGKNQWEEVLKWHPEVVTIFSLERAEQLSESALKSGKKQDILLKVYGTDDDFNKAQECCISLDDVSETADQIQKLEGVSIVGITAFPALQINEEKSDMVPTNNVNTLMKAKDILTEKGLPVKQVNGAGGTSAATLPQLSRLGITHAEPGHGLTGTTPLHAYRDLPEVPGMIYVTEVSHSFKDRYQVIAGGYYDRSHMKGCLVGHDENNILNQHIPALPKNPESIDYYGMITPAEDVTIKTGDTAIFAFRTQIFVTRAHIALV